MMSQCIGQLQVYTWGVATYEGGVQDGLRHGAGRLTISNSPAVYEGQWQHGKRHGKGVLYYDTARTAYYDGMYVFPGLAAT